MLVTLQEYVKNFTQQGLNLKQYFNCDVYLNDIKQYSFLKSQTKSVHVCPGSSVKAA